ncbi:MAG: hypothetical protein E7774_01395 [Bradyrhizobium sp.]|nr:MAG: hypothetical protein E7774_01395 [Bradyrhizobium sp.]
MPSKSPSAASRAVKRSAIDVALISAGLASAAASVVFAAAMVSRGDHAPLVNGMKYLAIFSQPRLHALPSSAPTVVAGGQTAPATGADGKAIDFDPTGSIFRVAGDDASQSDPYHLVAVEPGMAWLRNSAEMRVVKPGDIAPGLGRVAAIVKRDGRWTLIDDSGTSLLTADPPQSAAVAQDPFSRRMIFGGSE